MDVEGFCESMAESFSVPPELLSGPDERAEIEKNVAETLDFLDEHHVKGTFFVLGRIARQVPAVVRSIAQRGHEIASHGAEHLRLYNMSRKQVGEAVLQSKKILEDVSGTHVRGFRAPDFSINAETAFVLDLILEAGYEYDSSLFPISGHDVYGFPDIGRWFHRLPSGLVECPLSVFEIAGRRVPALGGGYFRLYPLFLTRRILRSIEKASHPAMFYIHPYELGSVCPELPGLSFKRRFRHYMGRTKTRSRFGRLFEDFRFGRVDEVLRISGLLN